MSSRRFLKSRNSPQETEAGRENSPLTTAKKHQDGSLLSARNMEDDFCKTSYSLHRCQLRVVEELIFVCLSRNPPPFDKVARDIEALYRPHGREKAQIGARVQHQI